MTKRDSTVIGSVLAVMLLIAAACTTAIPVAEIVERAAVADEEQSCGLAAPGLATGESTLPEAAFVLNGEIVDLLAGPPSTDFDPMRPIMVLDSRGEPVVLAPSWPIGIVEVTPVLTTGDSCHLVVSLDDPGFTVFNEIANLCFRNDRLCPTGQLAIVVEDRLISTPVVNSPSFDEPEFVVSKPEGFSRAEAAEIAAEIAALGQFRAVFFPAE